MAFKRSLEARMKQLRRGRHEILISMEQVAYLEGKKYSSLGNELLSFTECDTYLEGM